MFVSLSKLSLSKIKLFMENTYLHVKLNFMKNENGI